MYIQLDNAGFINKGAELMIYAVMDRLNKEPDLNPHFIKGKISGTTEQILKAGFFQIPSFQRYKIKWHNLLEQERFEPYGLVKFENVKTLIDIGGFQFGDQWAYRYTKEKNLQLADYYRKYKKNGTKLIFLPQAFGPFELPLSKERMKIVFEYADLIYAREKTSLNYLNTLLGNSPKIKLAPDFTSLVKPDISIQLYEKVRGGVCLIPNARMIDRTTNEVAKNYINYLESMSHYILNRGEKLILLNHEGEGDWNLIKSIQMNLKNSKNVVTLNNLNAYQVKAVIGKCKLLISSRFHGVVSGLNQGIPTFCTSWNHKYEELLADYQVSQNLLNPLDTNSAIKIIEKALSNPLPFVAKKNIIKSLTEKTKNMWNEVIKNINNYE